MKRILPLLLALVAVLCVSCGESTEDTYDAAGAAAAAALCTPVPTPTPEPTPTPAPYVLRETIPILMYHELGDGDNNLYLELDNFQAQLDWMEQNGVTPVTLQQVYDNWYGQGSLPEKPVVLTFDDGYRSMYTEAFPRLAEKGFPGTFFMCPATVYSTNFCTEEMIREMAEGGMEIGSHTYNHVEVAGLDSATLTYELTESKAWLKNCIGRSVDFFCYPSGRYDEAARRGVEAAGYKLAVTTDGSEFANRGEDPLLLCRVRIYRGEGAETLASVLSALGY